MSGQRSFRTVGLVGTAAVTALAAAGTAALVLCTLGPPQGAYDTSRLVWLILGGYGMAYAMLALFIVAWTRWGFSPVDQLEQQILDASRRTFKEAPLVAVTEWERLSHAVNLMVARVRIMLFERETALATIQAQTRIDGLTRIMSREHFIAALSAMLGSDNGSLLVVHALDVEGLNRRHGWRHTDDFLVACVTALRAALLKRWPPDGFTLARLNGPDFAILLPEMTLQQLQDLAAELHRALKPLAAADLTDVNRVAAVGGTLFRAGEQPAIVLSKADAVLGRAMLQSTPHAVSDGSQRLLSLGLQQWSALIEKALDSGRASLQYSVVEDQRGLTLHVESHVELTTTEGLRLRSEDFEGAAVRTGRILDLNLRALSLAVEELKRRPDLPRLCVCIDERSLERPVFHLQLRRLLDALPREVVSRLGLEVVLVDHVDGEIRVVKELIAELQSRGMSVGLARWGGMLHAMPLMAEGIAYVKLTPSVTRGMSGSRQRQRLLHLVCQLAARQGVDVLSEGLFDEEDRRIFFASGGKGVRNAAPTVNVMGSTQASETLQVDRSPRATTGFGSLV